MVSDRETRRLRMVRGVVIILLFCLVFAFGFGLYRESQKDLRFPTSVDDDEVVYLYKYKADTIEEFNKELNEFLDYIRDEGIKTIKIENTPNTELGVTIRYKLPKNKYLDEKGIVNQK